MLLLLMTGWTAAYGADYNIVDYGAKPDTTILCTAALQQAIDDCSRAGGGRVVVPAGMYKTGFADEHGDHPTDLCRSGESCNH